MLFELDEQQIKAIEKLRTGSILVGGVGSGKSRTALAYYFIKECSGKIPININGSLGEMKNPKDIFIITTARKRDTFEWDKEAISLMITKDRKTSISNIQMTIDSWNNIKKYVNIKEAFFIFDEQRLVGSGAWVKAFYKIVEHNNWILLSATPGDKWEDYIPVFIANGFYRNRTEFLRRHAIYNPYVKFQNIIDYREQGRLNRLRREIVVEMPVKRKTVPHHKDIFVSYDPFEYKQLSKKRWNKYKEQPIKNVPELCYLWRKVVNSDPSRFIALMDIFEKHPKIIVFYNFDYELFALKEMAENSKITYAEWNGHRHEPIPKSKNWMYFVQYTSGAEGWNCIETDTIVFFSLNYSYKIMVQSAGRIDRRNTPYVDLYYYYIKSRAPIDLGISRALKNKKNFNEKIFAKNI